MADAVQRLPLELWVEILEHVSIPDFFNFKQVNHFFHEATLTSPLIRHKFNLFATGFEYNPAARMSLADNRKALLQYRSNLDMLCPVGEMAIRDVGPRADDVQYSRPRMAGGVCAVTVRDSVWLFTPGSASRGIPQEEWETPIPPVGKSEYGFHPAADVIAYVKLSESWIRIHLRTLFSGGDHPDAQHPTINYLRQRRGSARDILTTSMTSSRLVVATWGKLDQSCLVVWDWKNAQVLFELNGQPYGTPEFIDDYRLLFCLDSGSNVFTSIVIVDTEAAGGVPTRTTFQLSPQFGELREPHLVLERGGHEPSPAESLAPFHQDPTQRIVALVTLAPSADRVFVFRAQALLELSKVREGSKIKWDEWRSCVVIPSINPDPTFNTTFWVSGCRLFCFHSTKPLRGTTVKLFDFSLEGRTKYLGARVSGTPGGVRYLSPTEADSGLVPDGATISGKAYCSHGSIVLVEARNALTMYPYDMWRFYFWTF